MARALSHLRRQRAAFLALILTFLVPLAVVGGLLWPLPLDLSEAFAPSIFGPNHVWCGEQIWRFLSGRGPLFHTTSAGFPWASEVRYLAWLPFLAVAPLRPFVGPLAAYNLVLLLSLPVSAVATWPLVRRWTGAGPWCAAAACIAFALCPFALGTLQAGELPKLQVGLLPLFLYTLQRALDAPAGYRWALAAALVAFVSSFTSVYFGMFLPPLCLGLLGLDSWRHRRLWRPLALGLLVAAALLPVGLYHWPKLPLEGVHLLFLPSTNFQPGQPLPPAHTVATLQDLVLGMPNSPDIGTAPRQVAYLGTALILVLAIWAWRRRELRAGRRAALVLLVAGAILSLGPVLYLTEQPTRIPLPAHLLHALHYPISQGGMYYRVAVIGSLGLALWLAAELAGRPRLAWLLLALHVGDALRASGPWPIPAGPVPGGELLARMEGGEGAILDLPPEFDPADGNLRMLRAAMSGRPTTTHPHISVPWERRELLALWESAFMAPDPDAALRALGVRFVVLDQPTSVWRAKADRLGPPWMEVDGLIAWDLGPASRGAPPP
ncbi:MAG: hypothetical protein ABIO70_19200 [Pseudomonadota bacterium]